MITDIGAAVTAGTCAIDTDRSRIRFTATHAFGLGPVTGTCAVRDGTITIASDPGACAAGARVDAASIATGNARRDQAVRAKRFLDVQEYPDMHAGGVLAQALGQQPEVLAVQRGAVVLGVTLEPLGQRLAEGARPEGHLAVVVTGGNVDDDLDRA
jgi:hypothetical protein